MAIKCRLRVLLISSNFLICIPGHVYAVGHLGPTEHSSSPWKEEMLRTHFLGISVPFLLITWYPKCPRRNILWTESVLY